MRNSNLTYRKNIGDANGKEIFEIQPVVLGGSPTDVRNKIALTREQHVEAVRYWNKLIRELRKNSNAQSASGQCVQHKSADYLADAKEINGGPFRVEVLQQLNTFRSDTTKPHNFDFYLYFPSEGAAQAAAKRIGDLERFKALVSVNRDQWLCRACVSMVPETAPLDALNEFFKGLAKELDGEFDGWESDIVRP